MPVRILVTGGSGFIGSHLVERLVSLGHKVTVLDLLTTGQGTNLANVKSSINFVQGSILDEKKVQSLISKSEYVFHLAAVVGVLNIVNDPINSIITNIQGTQNVLESCHNSKVPVLLASSSEVYGKNTSDLLSESDDRILGSPTILRWSYSETKALDESLAYAYYAHKNLAVRIVRFFNTVGPRQLGEFGMVLPRFINSALVNKPLEIYGDGSQTRCFTHVLDVVDALMLVAFAKNSIGKVLNIGNNAEISIVNLAKKIIKITNSKSKVKFMPYSEVYGDSFEDMSRRVPNIELIRKIVGWTPTRNLDVIISDILMHTQ